MKLITTTLLRITRRLIFQTPWLAVFAMVFAGLALSVQLAGAQSLAQTPARVADGSAKLIEHYNPNQMLRVTLSLRPPHRGAEDQFLKELYTKGSPSFHKFLGPDEWNRRFSPSVTDEQAVLEWAKSQGLTVTHRYPNRMLVNFEAPAGVLEKAFQVTLNRYHAGETNFFSSDREPQLPGGLHNIVTSVQGLNNLPRMHSASGPTASAPGPDYITGPVVQAGGSRHSNGDRKKFEKAMASSKAKAAGVIQLSTNGWYDPTDLYNSNAYDFQALYNQGHCCNPLHNPGGSPPETSIAIIGFGDLAYSDLNGFGNAFPYLAYNVDKFFINGGEPSCPPWDCGEVTMDAEWAIATSNSFGSYLDTAHVYLYESADQTDGAYTTIYNQMLTDNLARVLSQSFVCTEEVTATANSCDPAAMDARHAIFDAMVGQGWTLLSASGDWGAYNDCQHLSVAFPASDPDFVGVGGTYLTTSPSGFGSEMGWQGNTSPGSCASASGGSGGGCSIHFAAPSYQSTAACYGNRSVPDIALNAWHSETVYFQGAPQGFYGTSIATPEMAGFYAQENAYLLYISQQNGNLFGVVGRGTDPLYWEGYTNGAPHNPFYDITTGCNSNDVANVFYYCAGTGYDMVTGWGTSNMLQLSWAINDYFEGDLVGPTVSFTGPRTNGWFNTDQTVSWTVTDSSGVAFPPTGVSGFSQGWDANPANDVSTEPNPGSGNAFYSGPQFPNATAGCLSFVGAGGCQAVAAQGCHTAHVDAWDNSGTGSGDVTYGPVCYDSLPPTTWDFESPGPNANGWSNSANYVTIYPRDPGAGTTGSGIDATYYSVDDASCSPSKFTTCKLYQTSSPVYVSAEGKHTVYYFSADLAGNVQAQRSDAVNIDLHAPVTTASISGSTSVTVVLAATDNLSGVASTSYQLDGGTLTPYSTSLVVATAGNHTITFASTDLAGNVETLKSASFKVLNTSTTAVASSLNPSHYGLPVVFTASVNPPAATGTATFQDGSAVLGSATVTAGKALITVANLTTGTHSITARYGGDANDAGSTSLPYSEVVKKASSATLLVSSLNPSHVGRAVTFTATVVTLGKPTGSVTFKDGGATLGTVALNSTTRKATFPTAKLAAGTHSITATYSGDANFNPSTSNTVAQVVH